jgi:HlyD family secretion protein
MTKTLTTFILLALVGMAAYVAYERFSTPETGLQLMTAVVNRGEVVQIIDATGRLEAVTTVQVGSQVSGSIKALYADFNDRVEAGQVIAELEPSLFQAQVEQARAGLIRVEADVERSRVQAEDAHLKLGRTRALAARSLVPSTDLESAELTVRTADASLRAAEAQVVQSRASLNQVEVNLGHTVIAAPIDGVVISRSVDVGQTVAASMSAPELYLIANDLAFMRIHANVAEADIGLIEVGRPVTFQVDAFPGSNFTGTVSQVRLQPVVESNVVSYVTVIEVPNADLRLRPGMTANVTVEIARADNTLYIPASALRFSPTPEVFASLSQPEPGVDATITETAEIGANGPVVPEAGGGRGAFLAMSEEERANLRQQLSVLSPEERQARITALVGRSGRGRGGDGIRQGETVQDVTPVLGAPTQGRVWVLIDGMLQSVDVTTTISDGANVAVLGGGLQEGVVVAIGALETTLTEAPPASGSPLLQGFGGRRGGFGRGRGQ